MQGLSYGRETPKCSYSSISLEECAHENSVFHPGRLYEIIDNFKEENSRPDGESSPDIQLNADPLPIEPHRQITGPI